MSTWLRYRETSQAIHKRLVEMISWLSLPDHEPRFVQTETEVDLHLYELQSLITAYRNGDTAEIEEHIRSLEEWMQEVDDGRQEAER
jgi:CHASE3 domain sensor protein